MAASGLPAYADFVSEHSLQHERGPAARTRRPHVVIAVVGLLLVVAPLALGMFTRAAKGEQMLASFAPYVTQEQVDAFRGDFDVVDGARRNVLALQSSGSAPAGNYPNVDTFVADYPAIHTDLSAMLDTVEANLDGYRKLSELPPFGLLPFLFALPGTVLLITGLVGVRRAGKGKRTRVQFGIAGAVGIALIAAPLAFGIFAKAPAGNEVVDGFEPILTHEHVREVQGYFVTLVGGQGELDSRYTKAVPPGADIREIDALTQRWQPMTAQFAGFIGAMNDNVENFDAVVAMRDSTKFLGFGAFDGLGWFFLVPGVAALGTALIGSRR